jgi:hypothetical protein
VHPLVCALVSPPTKSRLKKPVRFLSSTQISTEHPNYKIAVGFLGLVCLTACGSGNYDVNNSTDRAAMEVAIQLDLTNNNCGDAITLSTQIFNSSYSNNFDRMLYASAQACNVGIQLFPLIQDLTTESFTTQDSVIRAFVRLFPSTLTDSRLTSAWYAQDALQSILNPGSVIGVSDQIAFSTYNPGSDLATDHTLDANSYMIFIGMSVIGTSLNRYGYASGQTPASLSYGKGQSLTWTSKALVQADTTGTACGIASGFLNLFDGIDQIVTYLGGSTLTDFQTVNTILEEAIELVGTTQCQADGYTATQAEAASFTAGVISGINVAWQ